MSRNMEMCFESGMGPTHKYCLRLEMASGFDTHSANDIWREFKVLICFIPHAVLNGMFCHVRAQLIIAC